MNNPARPGGLLKTGIIEALRLSVTEAAQALRITGAALSTFRNDPRTQTADHSRTRSADDHSQ